MRRTFGYLNKELEEALSKIKKDKLLIYTNISKATNGRRKQSIKANYRVFGEVFKTLLT